MQLNDIIECVTTHDKVIIGETLDMSEYSGVVKYYPEELVIIVKAGSTLR